MRWTIQESVEQRGVGVHGGQPQWARLHPAQAGHGVTLNGASLSPALISDGHFATTLATPTGAVRTVEHLLGAVFGLGITDVAIEAGDEVPILDGSAMPWVDALKPKALDGPLSVWRLHAPVQVVMGQSVARAIPAEAFSARVEIDFPAIGRQQLDTVGLDFAADIAPARTFGFLKDAPALKAAGLALGAGLENTLVFDGAAPHAGQSLRFLDEPVRHKCLDLFGDLAIGGAPFLARFHVVRGGHRLHHQLLRAVIEASSFVPA